MDKSPEWCLTTTVGRGDRWVAIAGRAFIGRLRQWRVRLHRER